MELVDVVVTIERELGAQAHALFAELDVRPLTAATIAQVHTARLADGLRVLVRCGVSAGRNGLPKTPPSCREIIAQALRGAGRHSYVRVAQTPRIRAR